MELIAYITIYLAIGFLLECGLSDEFEIWPVLIWPLMLIGCFILLIKHLIEKDEED